MKPTPHELSLHAGSMYAALEHVLQDALGDALGQPTRGLRPTTVGNLCSLLGRIEGTDARAVMERLQPKPTTAFNPGR